MKIRKTFEDFSRDPKVVADLRRLYKTPDDVDFVVGVQLDAEYFPGTTVPKSALIVSLFSLFGMGNSDRFSIGFAMMRCLLVDKPWDCHPSNGLEELVWARQDVEGLPDFRFYDKFWLTELDLQAHGTNLLWRLITENTEIKCVQQQPLFPADPDTNPILCALPKEKPNYKFIGLTAVQLVLFFVKKHYVTLIVILVVAAVMAVLSWRRDHAGLPPMLWGWPVLGNALAFQKDPKALLLKGFHKFQSSASGCFGIKLASLNHYVLTNPADLEFMKGDNPYEVKFNLHAFLKAINFGIITKKENFDSDVHTHLIRKHFGDPQTVAAFSSTVDEASALFIRLRPLTAGTNDEQPYERLSPYFSRYITFVISRCIVGPVGFDNKQLLDTFARFNDDAVAAMGLSSLLPEFLQFIAARKINQDFATIRKILVPIIAAKRPTNGGTRDPEKPSAFVDFIMEVIDNDERVAGESSERFHPCPLSPFLFSNILPLMIPGTIAHLDEINKILTSPTLRSCRNRSLGRPRESPGDLHFHNPRYN